MSNPTLEQPAPTLESALTFVRLHADQEDVDRVFAAAKERSKTLREVRAASVAKGANVRIANIKPKYYSGLTGTVTATKQNRTRTIVTIELDPDSTKELRFSSSHFIPDDIERYSLDGIPASCCHVL